MKVFISYAAVDADLAKSVAIGLRGQGHKVFFDHLELQPGDLPHPKIRKAVRDAYLLIFLARTESVSGAAYAMTEVGWFEKKCPVPKGRLLTVKTGAINIRSIPAYLRSVTVLDPTGDLSAAIIDHASRILGERKKKLVKMWIWIFILILTTAAIIYLRIKGDISILSQNWFLKSSPNPKSHPEIEQKSETQRKIPEKSENSKVDFKKESEDKLHEEIARRFVSNAPRAIHPASIARENWNIMWGISHNVIYRMEDIDRDGKADKFTEFYVREARSRDDKGYAFPPWARLEIKPSPGKTISLKVLEYSNWMMTDSDGDQKADKIERLNAEE